MPVLPARIRNILFFYVPVLSLTGASFLRFAVTGSLKVDENYPSGTWMYFLAALYIASFILSGIGYLNAVTGRWNLSGEKIKSLAYGMLFISFFMLPLVTNDIFSLFAYADIALQKYDPFTDGSFLHLSSYASYLGTQWEKAPCVYGPVNLMIAMAAVWLGKSGMFSAFFYYKFLLFLGCIGIIELSDRLLSGRPDSQKIRALIFLSPLLWFQGIGQAHNDLFTAMFLVAGFVYLTKNGFIQSAFFFALAVFSKWLAVIAFAVWAWQAYTAIREGSPRIFSRFIISGVVVIAIGIITYLPFWHGLETLTGPLSYLSEKSPAKSVTEVVSEIIVQVSVLIQDTPTGSSVVSSYFSLQGLRNTIWGFIAPCCSLLSLILCFFVLWKRRYADKGGRFFTGAILLVIAVTFYSPVFQPWYLIAVLPFFVFCTSRDWLIWGAVVSWYCNFEQVMHLMSRKESLYPVIVPFFVVTTVLLFFWKFKKRYLGTF